MRRFRSAPTRPEPQRGASPRTDDDTWLMPLPVPDAREGGDSTWALWHEAAKQMEEAFAATEPSDLAPLLPELRRPEEVLHAPRHRLTSDALMLVARRNNRVCPRAVRWEELYRLLGGDGYMDLQPPPLAVWNKLSQLQKRLRFKETIEWAERHRKLDVVGEFMVDLPEEEWVHMG